VAILAFASKLVHLPMRLVAAPLASVSFPRFVRAMKAGGEGTREAGDTAAWIVHLLAWSAAVAAGAAAPIAALTFGRGRFGADALASLGRTVAVLAPSVVAIGFLEVASKYLLAARRARSVLVAQVLGLLVYVASAPFLARSGVTGLALARDLAWGTAALSLAVPLVARERAVRGGDLLVSALAALVAYPAASWAASALSAPPFLRAGGAALAAAAVFLAATFALGAVRRSREP
jgi:peptidoglycan biosynthesis protein MviN/MurJ (putative lipid II flippase)